MFSDMNWRIYFSANEVVRHTFDPGRITVEDDGL